MIYRRAKPPARGEKKYDYHGVGARRSSYCAQIDVVDRSKEGGKRGAYGPSQPTQQLAARDADK